MSSRESRSTLIYLILSGTLRLVGAVIYTTLTVYYVTTIHMNPLQLVLVGTVLEGSYFLFEVPTGVVADTISRRLSVIIGVLVIAAAYLLEGAIPLFASILLAEGIRGVGETFLSGATEAWLAGEVGEEAVGPIYIRSGQINRVVSLVGVATSVGLASIRLNLPALAGGGLCLALGLFLVWTMPEHGFHPAPRGQRSTWQVMGHTFKASLQAVRSSDLLPVLLAVTFFAGAASEGWDRLWEAHLLTSFSLPALGVLKPVAWFGIISAVGLLLSLATTELLRPRLEALSQRPRGIARMLLILDGITMICVIVFALTGHLALAIVAVLIKGVADSLGQPLHDTWLIQNTEPGLRATMLSMIGQTNSLGQIAGGPGVGAVGVASMRAALALAGVLLSPIAYLYARVLRRRAPGLAEPLPEVTTPEA